MRIKSLTDFFSYCPGNNEAACGKNKFTGGESPENVEIDTLTASKNDACSYDIAGPKDVFKTGEVMFRVLKLKNLKVFVPHGSGLTLDEAKARRRLRKT
jgi:hypothetical protein